MGLAFILRFGDGNRDAIGLRIKWAKDMLFSERSGGYRHAWTLGPVYIRTYARTKPHD